MSTEAGLLLGSSRGRRLECGSCYSEHIVRGKRALTDGPFAQDGKMTAGHPPPEPPRFALSTSRQFTAWMAEQNLSLAFTTYQAGKVFLLGLQPDGRLNIFNRSFERCMGLCVTPDRLWLSSLYQLWCFENAL